MRSSVIMPRPFPGRRSTNDKDEVWVCLEFEPEQGTVFCIFVRFDYLNYLIIALNRKLYKMYRASLLIGWPLDVM